ncbi:MAG: hypothetical protein JW995_05220 [Melioribacteraceae bacterium]|nr:hypothetical protein [Melioribacteraceae bacterium]
MSTSPPPKVKKAADNSLEKQVYDLVELFKDNIPVSNDRYRFSYNLFKYMTGEGDPPEILIKSTKIEIEGIEKGELAAKINEELGKIKK